MRGLEPAEPIVAHAAIASRTRVFLILYLIEQSPTVRLIKTPGGLARDSAAFLFPGRHRTLDDALAFYHFVVRVNWWIRQLVHFPAGPANLD